jgi:hypothetical protein
VPALRAVNLALMIVHGLLAVPNAALLVAFDQLDG